MTRCADLAEVTNVRAKVGQLRDGAHVNGTEDRAAMHIALRAAPEEVITTDTAYRHEWSACERAGLLEPDDGLRALDMASVTGD